MKDARHKIIDADEWLAEGGSQVTLDLGTLMHNRVRDAIQSVHQLAEDHTQALVIQSSAVMSAITQHYVFTCASERRLVSADEYINCMGPAIREHVAAVFAAMSKKEENGKTRFQNLLENGGE